MITQYVEKDHRTWDEHILTLQFAYNTATHDATRYTPAYLNHGRELRTPEDTEQLDATADTPDVIRQKLTEAYDLVKIQLAQAFHRQKKHDLRRCAWKPSVGEWVWKRDHPLSKKSQAFNAKLAPKYSGPYEVRRSISPVIVDLRSKRGKWIRHVHIQDLKPAENKNIDENGDLMYPGDDNNYDQPEISAITDTDRIEMANREDIVEEINALRAEYEIAHPPPPSEISAASTDTAPPARPPRVGTVIQRSTYMNLRKQEALLAPPPPPPKPRQPRPYERTPPPARRTDPPPTPRPTLLQPMGPLPSPPIPVEVEPGIIVEISHFAVHVSRRYKPRTPQGRWIVRFTRDGKLRYSRRIE